MSLSEQKSNLLFSKAFYFKNGVIDMSKLGFVAQITSHKSVFLMINRLQPSGTENLLVIWQF